MGNDPLLMYEVKAKLKHLEQFLPNAASPATYEFGRFLADYLNTSLRPQEFVEEYRMAIADLTIGRNGFTDKRINGTIANYSHVVYETLSYELGKVADAVLPKEFADATLPYMNDRELLGH